MRNPKRSITLFLFYIVTIFLIGCNRPSNPENLITVVTPVPQKITVSATPTVTPSPTVTPTPAPTNTPTPTLSPTPCIVSITCSFAGDVTLGSDLVNQNSSRNFYKTYEKIQDDSYFFSNVLPYFTEDDLTLVNFEGVLSDRGERQDKTFAFRGDPSFVNILTKGSVEAVCLANNHSHDYGQVSHEDTKDILQSAGIAYSCDELVAYTTIKDIKIAMISVYVRPRGLEGCKTLLDKTIAEATAENADLIFTSFHWGVEKSSKITDEQSALAHYAIDLGADLVLGHHPHVLQPIEYYNGAYIVYSLANFCFGGNTNPKDKDTMIFQQTFTFTDSVRDKDDNSACVIPCSVSSTTERNDYCPTPQTGTEAERIIKKLNSYCSSYGLSFEQREESSYVPVFLSPEE